MSSSFTLTIDWLAFTLPMASVRETMDALGGEWTQAQTGFRRYPASWIMEGTGRGIGRLGTGARRNPAEVHVDLSAGIVASWSHEKVRSVIQWVLDKGGHLTRIDSALDDRASSVSLSTIKHAVDTGQCVTRAKCWQNTSSGLIHEGTPTGETLSLGRRQSQTLLRIYDKRLEAQTHGREDWQEYGIRWELELKKDRAQVCGQTLGYLDPSAWLEFLIGILRSYVDFRDTIRDEQDEYRYRAPLLDWWEQLTDGFQKGRLVVEKEPQTLAQVKQWVSKSLAPMLAVICVAEPDGQAWLNQQMDAGVDRWKDRHRRLLQNRPQNVHRAKTGPNETSG